jgi:hypothetical protein
MAVLTGEEMAPGTGYPEYRHIRGVLASRKQEMAAKTMIGGSEMRCARLHL